MSTKKSNVAELNSSSSAPIQAMLNQPIEPLAAKATQSAAASNFDPKLMESAMPAVDVGARGSEVDRLRDVSVADSAESEGEESAAPDNLSVNDALRGASVIDSIDHGATPSPFDEFVSSTAFPSYEGQLAGSAQSSGTSQSGLSPDDRPENPLQSMLAAPEDNSNVAYGAPSGNVKYEEGEGVKGMTSKQDGYADTTKLANSFGGSELSTPLTEAFKQVMEEIDSFGAQEGETANTDRTEVYDLGDETITKTTSADGQIEKWTFSADGSVVIVNRNNGTTTGMNADGSTKTTNSDGELIDETPPTTGCTLDEGYDIPEEMAWLLENDLARLRAQQPDHIGDDVDPVDASTGALAGVDDAAGSLDDPKNRYLGGDTHDPDGPVYTGGGSDPEAGGDVDPNPDESGPPQTSGPEEDIPSRGSQPERPNQSASGAESDGVGERLGAMSSFELPIDALAVLLAADEFAASQGEEELEDSLADSIEESVAKLDFDVLPDLGPGWPQLGTDVADLNTGDFGV